MALVTKDSAWYALGVIGWMSLVQILEGNFITPYIVGDQVKINPFMVLVFLLTAGKVWGVIGLMVAIPMAAVFKQICYHVPALNSVRYLMNPFPQDPKGSTKTSKFSLKNISTFKQS
jgi:predicted PurR-regulated permease PerM